MAIVKGMYQHYTGFLYHPQDPLKKQDQQRITIHLSSKISQISSAATNNQLMDDTLSNLSCGFNFRVSRLFCMAQQVGLEQLHFLAGHLGVSGLDIGAVSHKVYWNQF